MRGDLQNMNVDLGPVLVSGATPQQGAQQLLRISSSDDMHVLKGQVAGRSGLCSLLVTWFRFCNLLHNELALLTHLC